MLITPRSTVRPRYGPATLFLSTYKWPSSRCLISVQPPYLGHFFLNALLIGVTTALTIEVRRIFRHKPIHQRPPRPSTQTHSHRVCLYHNRVIGIHNLPLPLRAWWRDASTTLSLQEIFIKNPITHQQAQQHQQHQQHPSLWPNG